MDLLDRVVRCAGRVSRLHADSSIWKLLRKNGFEPLQVLEEGLGQMHHAMKSEGWPGGAVSIKYRFSEVGLTKL